MEPTLQAWRVSAYHQQYADVAAHAVVDSGVWNGRFIQPEMWIAVDCRSVYTVRAHPGRLHALRVSYSETSFAWFCMALLCGRAGRLTAQNGGFWPGQIGAFKLWAHPSGGIPELHTIWVRGGREELWEEVMQFRGETSLLVSDAGQTFDGFEHEGTVKSFHAPCIFC